MNSELLAALAALATMPPPRSLAAVLRGSWPEPQDRVDAAAATVRAAMETIAAADDANAAADWRARQELLQRLVQPAPDVGQIVAQPSTAALGVGWRPLFAELEAALAWAAVQTRESGRKAAKLAAADQRWFAICCHWRAGEIEEDAAVAALRAETRSVLDLDERTATLSVDDFVAGLGEGEAGI